MKYTIFIKTVFVSAILVFWASCTQELDDFSTEKPSTSVVDFSTYVALGNSLTAGYQDGSVFYEGQLYSYPNIVAQQLIKAGFLSNFNQPYVDATKYPEGISTSGVRIYFNLDKMSVFYKPSNYSFTKDLPTETVTNGSQIFHNLGIPGAKSYHLVYNGYGNAGGLATNPTTANPYFVRLQNQATNANQSVIEKAVAANPSFFTLFIGNNDVLGYASAAGASDAITPTATLKASIKAEIAALVSCKNNTAHGIVLGLPDILVAPFFTTINASIKSGGAVAIAAYQNMVFIDSKTGTPRKLDLSKDYFVLSASSKVAEIKDSLTAYATDVAKAGAYITSNAPTLGKYILDENEISKISTAISEYNKAIQEAVSEAGAGRVVYLDVLDFANQFKDGVVMQGRKYTTAFVTGGIFGFDGVHITNRGAGFLANRIINKINATYNTNVPLVDINTLPDKNGTSN